MNQLQRVLVRKQITDRWHGTRRKGRRRNRCGGHEACLTSMHKGARAAQSEGSSCGKCVALLAKMCRLKPSKQSSDEARARIQHGKDVFSHASVMVLHEKIERSSKEEQRNFRGESLMLVSTLEMHATCCFLVRASQPGLFRASLTFLPNWSMLQQPSLHLPICAHSAECASVQKLSCGA